ncbi:response regulator transcription factor [uncultured Ramlibacter sp.]|uniref:response regulator transcription factor n=1 Tax=uncultured Ramlibacter sp. TaxID=260755 RepID=UPI002611AB34|nr:response regulator transcription factor [uncultured Ramlibacter sp.]
MNETEHSLKVAVLHQEPVLALGLTATLGRELGVHITTSVADADVIVSDYTAALELAKTRDQGRLRIVVITAVDREHDIRRALDCGIQGYLLQHCTPEELSDAVRAVGRGSRYLCSFAAQSVAESLTRNDLTPRELEVLRLLALGCSNKLAARDLDVALATVKMHVKSILSKLNACSRTQAVSIAANRGLVAWPRVSAHDLASLDTNLADAVMVPMAQRAGASTRSYARQGA